MERSGYIWQEGLVTDIDGGMISVRFERLRQCQRCFDGEGCGAGVFSRLFSRHAAELSLPNHQGLTVGQDVRVGIGAGDMLMLAFVVYLVPVLAFILVAALTATLDYPLWAQDLTGLVAGSAAALSAVYLTGRFGGHVLNPRLEVLSASSGCTTLECSNTKGQI